MLTKRGKIFRVHCPRFVPTTAAYPKVLIAVENGERFSGLHCSLKKEKNEKSILDTNTRTWFRSAFVCRFVYKNISLDISKLLVDLLVIFIGARKALRHKGFGT